MKSDQESPANPSTSGQGVQEAIRRRAEEIYLRNGGVPGKDIENWEQAEREIHEEMAASGGRKAIVVIVDGVQYVGEYSADSAGGYVPGEFSSGAPIPVRFVGERMFVKRPNGTELETTIVKKSG